MNKSVGLALFAVLTGCLVSCSKGDETDSDTDNLMPTGTPTTDPTAPGVAPSGGDTTTPPTPGQPPAPAQVTGTPQPNLPNGGAGPGTGGSGPMSPFPACGSVSYETSNGSNMTPALDGGRSIYFFGDGATTGCGQLSMAGQACLYGETDTSAVGDDMYKNWGAGMGLQLAKTDASGNVVEPFDAAALGIAGLKFTVVNFTGRPTRVQLSQVDDPTITDPLANYSQNGFVWGGSSPESITADGEQTLLFSQFELPSWTKILDAEGAVASGQPLDPTKLHSLQFQIANNPGDTATPYGFCITNLQWTDATGNPIVVGLPMDDGGAGGSGAGGSATGGSATGGSATGGSGTGGSGTGGMGGSGMGGSGMGGGDIGGSGTGGAAGGGGGDVPSFSEVHAIFMAKCTPCHDTMNMRGGRTHGQADEAAAYMSATMMPEEIADRINREEDAEGKMPPAMGGTPLTAEEIATITAWVEGGTPE